jgi:hypothetical protein
MNEGCKGGWPLTNGLFGEYFDLPSEKCAPYKAATQTCSSYKHCPGVARVEKSYYIGGAYGKSTEEKMMQEIRSKGPIIGDIKVPMEFSYYSKGILSEDFSKKVRSMA